MSYPQPCSESAEGEPSVANIKDGIEAAGSEHPFEVPATSHERTPQGPTRLRSGGATNEEEPSTSNAPDSPGRSRGKSLWDRTILKVGYEGLQYGTQRAAALSSLFC